MDMKEKICAWMAGREDEFTQALAKLIAVDSTMGEPALGCPFGEGTARALKTALSMAEEWGFATGEDEGYVGYADLNDRADALHILAHLDIVGVGEGWNTDPFTLVRDGDLVYGRGVQDDKGPALAALFAMRCVKELGLPGHRALLCLPSLCPLRRDAGRGFPGDQCGKGALRAPVRRRLAGAAPGSGACGVH